MADHAPSTLPTVRELRWCTMAPALRTEAVRELAAAEGLDGNVALAAVAHALRVPGSPWGPALDRAVVAALDRCIMVPLTRFGRALAASLGPALDTLGRALPPGPTCPCWCVQLHPGVDVCVLEADELEVLTLAPAVNGDRRTIRVCGPCADAYRVRARLSVG